MDVSLNRRRKKVKVVAEEDHYPLDMSMYPVPPFHKIHIDEFQDFAFNRLKVLRILEVATAIGKKLYSQEWKDYVVQELHAQKLRTYIRLLKSDGKSKNPTEADLEACREDNVSHYILRLAYCKDVALRKWLLSREVELFKWRFSNLTDHNAKEFLKLHNLKYNAVSEDERNEFREELIDCTSGNFVFDTMTFYKLPWTEISSLLDTHKVFLRDGFVYLPHFELVSVVSCTFRSQLNESLTKASKTFHLSKDIRLDWFLKNVHSIYVGTDYSKDSDGKITSANIHQYAENFPLCMRFIYEEFTAKNHLKHGSRLQYTFFLKATGMLYDDLLQYWRSEFTKKIDDSQFEKKYVYGIKHAYGKVGKMQSYSAYNCGKIISASVSGTECHGCPFKHWDNESLGAKLANMGLRGDALAQVLKSKTEGHYQIACTKYFEFTHENAKETKPIEHPNQYFEESCAIRMPKSAAVDPKKAKNVKVAKVENKTKVEEIEVDLEGFGDADLDFSLQPTADGPIESVEKQIEKLPESNQ